jgi:hypothetical protein
MKRTLEAVTRDVLHIVDGCVCDPTGQGQGNCDCDCPRWLEATEEQLKHRSEWKQVDVQGLKYSSSLRKEGNIVSWYGTPLIGACAKRSFCHKALVKYDIYSRELSLPQSYRFIVAFFMNGFFTYAFADDLVPIINDMEQAQNGARSTVNGAVFIDRVGEKKKIWCFEAPEKGWLEPLDWIKPGGALAASSFSSDVVSTMKRTLEADQSVACDDALYIVQGCVCPTGEGWDDGCDCPPWVEVTEADYKRRGNWTRDDIDRIVRAGVHRQEGNIVQWRDVRLAKPCRKRSMSHRALVKYDEIRTALILPDHPRFIVAYFLNGRFHYLPTEDLSEILLQMDKWEDVCRSTVNAAVFVDLDEGKMFCIEPEKGKWIDCWTDLLKPEGDLASCAVVAVGEESKQ